MNGLPYYKRYPRDFIEGTQGMPYELKVVYSFILDLIYVQSGRLPDDPRYIAGVLGVSVRKWNSLRQGLIDSGKLAVSGGHLTNYRALSELESLAKLQDKQRENATGPRKNKYLRKPRRSHTESEPYNPPTPQEGGSSNLEFLGGDPSRQRKLKAIRNCIEWQTRHITAEEARGFCRDGDLTEDQCRKAGVL